MSQENVDLVGAMYEAFLAGDTDASLGFMHEDIRWSAPPEMPEGEEVSFGRSGARDALNSWLDMWTDYQFEIRGIEDHGDHVLVSGWQSGRGKGSGIEVSEEIISVWTVRDGLIVEQQMFRDRAQALTAAGAAESVNGLRD
jgi:ketosteroid isomerase-like protein